MDLNKNFENAKVTIPYNDFVKALMDAVETTQRKDFKQSAYYINDLVRDVVMDKITIEEANDFEFF